MSDQHSSFIKKYGNTHLLPQEEKLLVQSKGDTKTIGVPKERAFQEKRVSLVPSAVGYLVENGHRVLMEREAGLAANFPDYLYAENGAEIVENMEQIYNCDIVTKIAPPTIDEVKMMKDRLMLISALHLKAQGKEFFQTMVQKRITAFSYEHIRDTSHTHPVLHSISEIAGNTAILIAAEYLSDINWGRGKMLGGFTGINPSEVIILGAGTVGESAARAALGFGALVKVFDNSLTKLNRLQNNIGQKVYTSIIQPDVLTEALRSADVVIGALYQKPIGSTKVITEKMVEKMKKGAVIVDVSIDSGGCSETSHETNHNNPVYKVHDVTHYCVPNISSRTPHTASYALSNYFGPFLQDLSECGSLNQFLINNKGIRSGVYLYNGKVTNEEISQKFNFPHSNIELYLASY